MLYHIPSIISPDLLKVLDEMGHADCICIGDRNFPGHSLAQNGNAVILREDGIKNAELLEAILKLMPLDQNAEQAVMLMEKSDFDKDLDIAIWKTYEEIIKKYDSRGTEIIKKLDRQNFYSHAGKSYCRNRRVGNLCEYCIEKRSYLTLIRKAPTTMPQRH